MHAKTWVDFEDLVAGDEANVRADIRVQLLSDIALPWNAVDELTEFLLGHYKRLRGEWAPRFEADMDMKAWTYPCAALGDLVTLSIGIRSAFGSEAWNARFVREEGSYTDWVQRPVPL